MKCSFRSVALATLALTITALSVAPATACNGRSGRRAFRAHVPFATSHRDYQPSYRRNVYPSPTVYVQPQQVVSTPPVQPQAPVAQTVPVQTAPQPNTAIQATTKVQQTQPTAPATSQTPTTPTNTEASALQLLQSLDKSPAKTTEPTPEIPQFSSANKTTSGTHVGTWKVSLPGNQSVELSLKEDGSFRWTASRNGNASTFSGQYRLESGRLTLVRSTDLQQMAGSWTANGQNFTFKLDGAKTGGLAFARS